MLTIALVNMPFAALQRPSIALTQLKAVTDRALGAAVRTTIHYLNQDFGRRYGVERYQHVVQSIDAHNAGFGDWFFRQAAFPEAPDNTDEYFRRYYVQPTREHELIRQFVGAERPRLGAYLDELIERHRLDEADLVGLTSMFAQNVASFALARHLKTRRPGIVIAVGGANCEGTMGREIADRIEAIDFTFSGPALRSFPEFVRALGEGALDACDRLDGVFSRRNRLRTPGAGTIAIQGVTVPLQRHLGPAPPAPNIPPAPPGDASALPEVGAVGPELDVDAEVPLDYDDFMATLDRNFPAPALEPTLLFETSRGCWWGERAHCTFCGLNSESMGYRAMSPPRAHALIASLFRYAPRLRRLESVDNIMPKSYLRDLFPALETPEGLTIFYEVKADLSDGDLAVLARAGVRSLQPGIEALATSTLRLMKKGTSALGNIRFLKSCLRHGVYPEWNLLIGFPGEDEAVYEAYERDLPLFTHLPPPSGVYPVRFDRFSPYFTRAGDYHLDLHPYDFYSLVYPFPSAALGRLAYYFVDRNFGAEYATRTARWIGALRARVEGWRERWHGRRHAPAPPPRLSLEQGAREPWVHDSRRGTVREYRLPPVAARLLDALEVPTAATELSHRLALDPHEVDDQIAWLLERGLLAEESGRLLALPCAPAPEARQPSRALPPDPERPAIVARARRDRRADRASVEGGMRE